HVRPGAPAPVPTDWSRAERLRTTRAWDELQAALAAGASFSHHAQGGGIWPDGAGMPDPQPQAPHQPTRHLSRPSAGEVIHGRLRWLHRLPLGLSWHAT